MHNTLPTCTLVEEKNATLIKQVIESHFLEALCAGTQAVGTSINMKNNTTFASL